jgi:hypothetical protein
MKKRGIGIAFSKPKLLQLFLKNPWYYQIKTICGILNGEISDENEGIGELLSKDISCFKYALIMSCDVQRNFSKYNYVLRNNRNSFHFKNFKSYFITLYWYLF